MAKIITVGDTEERYYLNGEIKITITYNEVRNGYWALAPKIENITFGKALVDISDSNWDVWGINENDKDKIVLNLRKFPGLVSNVSLTIFKGNIKNCLLMEKTVSFDELPNELEDIKPPVK